MMPIRPDVYLMAGMMLGACIMYMMWVLMMGVVR